MVCALDKVEDECRSCGGGDGSEYRSALDTALCKLGTFLVMFTEASSIVSTLDVGNDEVGEVIAR